MLACALSGKQENVKANYKQVHGEGVFAMTGAADVPWAGTGTASERCKFPPEICIMPPRPSPSSALTCSLSRSGSCHSAALLSCNRQVSIAFAYSPARPQAPGISVQQGNTPHLTYSSALIMISNAHNQCCAVCYIGAGSRDALRACL
jgi:hypothetical protein